jgi:hypothetical protein
MRVLAIDSTDSLTPAEWAQLRSMLEGFGERRGVDAQAWLASDLRVYLVDDLEPDGTVTRKRVVAPQASVAVGDEVAGAGWVTAVIGSVLMRPGDGSEYEFAPPGCDLEAAAGLMPAPELRID